MNIHLKNNVILYKTNIQITASLYKRQFCSNRRELMKISVPNNRVSLAKMETKPSTKCVNY